MKSILLVLVYFCISLSGIAQNVVLNTLVGPTLSFINVKSTGNEKAKISTTIGLSLSKKISNYSGLELDFLYQKLSFELQRNLSYDLNWQVTNATALVKDKNNTFIIKAPIYYTYQLKNFKYGIGLNTIVSFDVKRKTLIVNSPIGTSQLNESISDKYLLSDFKGNRKHFGFTFFLETNSLKKIDSIKFRFVYDNNISKIGYPKIDGLEDENKNELLINNLTFLICIKL